MSDTIERLRERSRATLTVLRAPRVRIEMYGSEEVHGIHAYFTARHPRIKVAANKRWGIALLPMPDTFADYIDGRARKAVRQNRRRAEGAGFRYELISPTGYLDDILAINRSAPTRQGRPMREAYVDADEVRSTFARHKQIHGIIDADGHLQAYAVMRVIGDAYMLTMLIGHADALEHGVMYLLVSEVIRGCVEERGADGRPHWLMADTFWGAKAGLAYFKERCGFRPFTVDWVWLGEGPPGPP